MVDEDSCQATTRKGFLTRTAAVTAGIAAGTVGTRLVVTQDALAATTGRAATANNVVTLRFMHHENVFTQQLTSVIKQFEATHPSIKIQQELTPWTQAFNLLTNDAATGHSPDLMVLGDTWPAAFAPQGMLRPLDKWINAWKLPDGKPVTSQWYEGDKLFYHVQGHYYGSPMLAETRALYYRTDWLAEAGLAGPPRTHDEFVSVAKKLTNRGKNRYGYGLLSSPDGVTFQNAMTWITQRGGTLFKKVSYGLAANTDAPAFVSALRWYTDLALKHKVTPPSYANFSIADAESGFQAGALGMIVTGPSYLPQLKANSKMNGKWNVALLPHGPANNYAFLGGVPISMSSQTQHPEEAWAFIKYMTTPDNELGYLRPSAVFPGWISTAREQAPWSTDPHLQTFAAEIKLARPNSYPFPAPPVLASMTDGQMPLQYELQGILAGQETVEQGAQRATVGINTMLRQYYQPK